jgi:pimeloyl-ACP methyl ester carboxylesterase
VTLWTELLGSELRFVGGPGYRTRALFAGEGEPLLLLHGQGGSLENFCRNIPAYARHHRVVAIDFLSHGLSDKPDIDGPLVPVLVDHVLHLMDHLGLPPCPVEGQSQGGWVAATLALAHPERVTKLVLTTPTGLEAEVAPTDEAKLAAQLADNLAILANPGDDAVRRRMARLVSDPALIDEETFTVRRWMMQNPEVNAGLQAASRAYLSPANQALRLGPDELAQLAMPVLLYWGSHNVGGRPAGDALAAALPHWRYHCAEVGHWAQYERADEHNAVVIDFLTGKP